MHIRALAFLLFLTQVVLAQQPTPILPDPTLTPGSTFDVTMHDGSHLQLRKLEEDYDPSNRIQAITRLSEAHEKGEVLTGVFYVNTKAPSFIDMLNIVDEPLATLPDSVTRPGREALAAAMEELK